MSKRDRAARIFFIRGRVHEKTTTSSADLLGALAEVYLTVSATGTREWRFNVTEKQYRAVASELARFDDDNDPVRAVALALQNYGDKLVYDFTFSAEVEKTGRETFFGSFDYADQLSTYSDRRAA